MSMDIFNRPPQIADDTLHYTLHFGPEDDLSSLATLILAFVNDDLLPKDFVWHRDRFELKLASGGWLEGTMRVGDAVDDEWCVVWILREISKKWDCVISVADSDGQFLLIEAADSLPSWVTPSNAENRVWIYQGHLHLVPLSQSSPSHTRSRSSRPLAHTQDSDDEFGGDEDAEGWITVPAALEAVRSPDISTQASPVTEMTLWTRISSYPAALGQHTHHTLAYLPVSIALALKRDPSLIQKATEAFYTRDALQLRAVHKMTRFPPKPDVLTRVGLTRTAYAQVAGQRFGAPKVFGRPPGKEGDKERRWWEVGMKIACGFEMLYQESKGRSTAGASQASIDGRIDALRRDAAYNTYIANLKKAGYFHSELEGSAKWKELEVKASEAYVNARRQDDASRPSFASQVESALAPPAPDISEVTATPDTPEDSEEWLSVTEEELEGMLAQANAKPSSKSATATQDMEEGKAEEKAAERLKELAKKVEEFVEGEGDVEGAEFPDDVLSDEDMASDEGMEDFNDDLEEGDSDDDIEMDDTERRAAMDKLVQPLAEGEYGKMPENYRNPAPMSDVAMAEAEDKHSLQKADSSDKKGKGKQVEEEPLDMSTGYRAPLLPRDEFEGVSDDSDLDPAGQGFSDEEEGGEDAPQVIGEMDVEPDMGEEGEDFVKFARHALGIGQEEWDKIVKEREGRGAFVPKPNSGKIPDEGDEPSDGKVRFGPPLPPSAKKASSKRAMATPSTQTESFFTAPPLSKQAQRTPRQAQSGPRPNANPNLDSFEKVMEAMEEELKKARGQKAATKRKKVDKGKGKARAPPSPPEPEEDMDDDDISAAMDAELRSALARDEEGDDEAEVPMDYNLIKNFLESVKSQAGLAGPVSGMVGRLDKGWVWPRDEGEEDKL